MLGFKQGIEVSLLSTFKKYQVDKCIKIAREIYEKNCGGEGDEGNRSVEGEENLLEESMRLNEKSIKMSKRRRERIEKEKKMKKMKETSPSSSQSSSQQGNKKKLRK